MAINAMGVNGDPGADAISQPGMARSATAPFSPWPPSTAERTSLQALLQWEKNAALSMEPSVPPPAGSSSPCSAKKSSGTHARTILSGELPFQDDQPITDPASNDKLAPAASSLCAISGAVSLSFSQEPLFGWSHRAAKAPLISPTSFCSLAKLKRSSKTPTPRLLTALARRPERSTRSRRARKQRVAP